MATKSKFYGEGLTFDDVLLVPAYSEVLPREVNIQSYLTRDIQVNMPMVSAAMDTVTEDRLAIALAREGGIGILHKNMSIEKQAELVRKVKRQESGLIIDPITLSPEASVGDALRLMREHKIGGIPIVDAANKLVGILTNRDLRFEKNPKKKIKEVMTKDKLVDAPATRAFTISPVYRIPPSAITGIPLFFNMLAASITALNCGTPAPVTMRVVQIEPGPTPTFTASAPASAKAFAPAAVATLPAITCTSLNDFLTNFTISNTPLEWP